jgi:carbon-monoxide dehydrogenase medium subunit
MARAAEDKTDAAAGCGIRSETMYSFTFERPTTVRQASGLLAKNAEAKLLAGGHSLIPVMKLRLASPPLLIDLSKVDGLKGIEVSPRSVTIGAMTTHDEVANSREVVAVMPGLCSVPASIGDPHVRLAGTIGGSIANYDPNADYPAACLGLGATIVTSKRKIMADDFFKGMFETALEPDEIITKVSFPIAKKAAYQKFKHPASGFALVGVFVSKRSSEIRVAVTGAGASGVFRVKEFEDALKKRFAPKSLEGLSVPATGLNSDIHAGADYRAHLIGVLARRAVAAANEKGGGDED